jgi:hypothetical protein
VFFSFEQTVNDLIFIYNEEEVLVLQDLVFQEKYNVSHQQISTGKKMMSHLVIQP